MWLPHRALRRREPRTRLEQRALSRLRLLEPGIRQQLLRRRPPLRVLLETLLEEETTGLRDGVVGVLDGNGCVRTDVVQGRHRRQVEVGRAPGEDLQRQTAHRPDVRLRRRWLTHLDHLRSHPVGRSKVAGQLRVLVG